MQAVILAAGQSSRFYPYNTQGHKSLTTIGGKTLIQRTLESLKKAKVTDVVIVEGIDEAISKSLSEKETKGLAITFVIQEQPLGMGEALLSIAKHLRSSFFLLSGYHFEFHLFFKEFLDAKGKEDAVVVLTKEENDTGSFGVVTRENGKVVVSEKKQTAKAERIIGMYLLNRDFIQVLHEEKKDHYSFENAITQYAKNKKLYVLSTKKETLTLKYPWDILGIKDYILKTTKRSISKTATISKQAVVRGDVYVDDDVIIMDGAVITGPCYIGKGVYVGTNAIIRNGVTVEENAVIGAQMEVKNSVIFKGVTTHSGFIGDSIIGIKTRIAAGFHSGNVRLDRREITSIIKGEKVNTHKTSLGVIVGSNSSIGIKVGTMPGIIIGNNCIIGPGTTVMENVEDDTTYYTKFQAIVKKKQTS